MYKIASRRNMQPLELAAAVYIIGRVNRLNGTKIPVPLEAVNHPLLWLGEERRLRSSITGRPVKIGGRHILVIDDRLKFDGSDVCINQPSLGSVRRKILGFIIHALDGITLPAGDEERILDLALLLSNSVTELGPWLATMIVEQQKEHERLLAENAELRGRIMLLSESK